MTIRPLLTGGDRRSIAKSNRARRLIEQDPSLVTELASLVSDEDWLVAQRAVDLLEKLAHEHRDWIEPHKKRSRFAPTFYACSLSMVSYLAGHVGLNELIDLFAYGPAEMNARLERLRGRKLSEWRAEWLQFVHIAAGVI
jgi:hypothetical protein